MAAKSQQKAVAQQARQQAVAERRKEDRQAEKRRRLREELLQGRLAKGPVELQLLEKVEGAVPKSRPSEDARAFLQVRQRAVHVHWRQCVTHNWSQTQGRLFGAQGRSRSYEMVPLAAGMRLGHSIKMRRAAPAAVFKAKK